MTEQDKSHPSSAAPSRMLTPGEWIYRTAGEGLRLAGPAGEAPTALVQILATTWQRSPQQTQELTEAFRRLKAWSCNTVLLPIDFGLLPKTGVYMSFPLRNGKLLRQIVGTQQHVYSLEQTVQILRPLAEALDRGHNAGLLHLALSPAQIVVGRSLGDCCLIDFGLRQVVLAQDQNRDLALDRDRWSYWAPEVWARSELGPATDQFALASLGYLLLSGRFLVDAPNATAAAFECLHRLSAAVVLLPSDVQPIFHRALAAQPQDRFSTCASFVAELEAATRPAQQEPVQSGTLAVAEEPLDVDADYDVLTDFEAGPETRAPGRLAPAAIDPTAAVSLPGAKAGTPDTAAAGGGAAGEVAGTTTSSVPHAPRRRRARAIILNLLALILLISLPLASYGWTVFHRPRLARLELKEDAPADEKLAVVPDSEVRDRVAYIEKLLNQLQVAQFAALAPAAWQESKKAAELAQTRSKSSDLQGFVEAADAADEKLEGYVVLCAHLARFQKEYEKATTAMKLDEDSPAALIKRHDARGWEALVKLYEEAGSLRQSLQLATAQEKLNSFVAMYDSSRWKALQEVAINGKEPTERLTAASMLLAGGRGAEKVSESFDEGARALPDFWLEKAAHLLGGATPEESAFGGAETALILQQLQDPRWKKAFAVARQGAQETSDAAARCEAWERLLEVSLELKDAEATRQILDDIRGKGAPPEMLRRLLGYALLVGYEPGWIDLAPKAFAADKGDAAGLLEPLTVFARYSGDFSAARRLVIEGAGIQARCELALAAAERQDREKFAALMDDLSRLAPALPATDQQIIGAHRDAGEALLGDFARVAGTLATRATDIRDFVGTYVALAAARENQLDLADQALGGVGASYQYRVRALREIAGRHPQNPETRLSQLYQWVLNLPTAADRSTACAAIYAALRERKKDIAAAANEAPQLPTQVQWVGKVLPTAQAKVSPSSKRPSRDRKDSESAPPLEGVINVFARRNGKDSASGDGYIEFVSSKDSRSAATQFSARTVFLDAPGVGELTSGNTTARGTPHLQYLLIPGAESTLGVVLRAAPELTTKLEVAGLLTLGRGATPTAASLAELETKQLSTFFTWLVESGYQQGMLIWPSGTVNKNARNEKKQKGKVSAGVVSMKVIGTRKELDLVRAKVAEINQILPEGIKINCIDKVHDLGEAGDHFDPGWAFVHFASGSTHVGLAQSLYRQQWPAGKSHWCRTWYTAASHPLSSVVMIDNSELKSDTPELERAVSIELLRVLGLAHSDNVYSGAVDSIFARPQEGVPLNKAMTDLDKKLVNFIYTKCSPNLKTEVARGQFESSWATYSPKWTRPPVKKAENETP